MQRKKQDFRIKSIPSSQQNQKNKVISQTPNIKRKTQNRVTVKNKQYFKNQNRQSPTITNKVNKRGKRPNSRQRYAYKQPKRPRNIQKTDYQEEEKQEEQIQFKKPHLNTYQNKKPVQHKKEEFVDEEYEQLLKQHQNLLDKYSKVSASNLEQEKEIEMTEKEVDSYKNMCNTLEDELKVQKKKRQEAERRLPREEEEKSRKLETEIQELRGLHLALQYQIQNIMQSMPGMMMLRQQMGQQQLDPDNMTYEQLLNLGNQMGNVGSGLTQQQIARIPVLKYGVQIPTKPDDCCSICFSDYKRNEKINKLNCNHYYHQNCIANWLKQKRQCPVCKVEVQV